MSRSSKDDCSYKGILYTLWSDRECWNSPPEPQRCRLCWPLSGDCRLGSRLGENVAIAPAHCPNCCWQYEHGQPYSFELLSGIALSLHSWLKLSSVVGRKNQKNVTFKSIKELIIKGRFQLSVIKELKTKKSPWLWPSQRQRTQTIQWANQNSKQIHAANAKKTCRRASHHWFYFWLDEKVARAFIANHLQHSFERLPIGACISEREKVISMREFWLRTSPQFEKWREFGQSCKQKMLRTFIRFPNFHCKQPHFNGKLRWCLFSWKSIYFGQNNPKERFRTYISPRYTRNVGAKTYVCPQTLFSYSIPLKWFLRNKIYRWIFLKLSLNVLYQALFRKIQ